MKNKLYLKPSMPPALFTFRLFRPGVELLIKGLESLYVNEIHGKMISGETLSREEESRLQQLEEDVMSLKKFLENGINKQTLKSKKKLKLWITRDKDGTLFFHRSEPERFEYAFFSLETIGSINSDFFSSVTWENSPQKVELKLIEDTNE